MSIEDKWERVCEAWRAAAKDLSIEIEIPYLMKTSCGKEIRSVAYLPDFGGPKGMVISLYSHSISDDNKDLQSAAKSQGLYYSFINPEFYQRYDEKEFREALADWGYFGTDNRRPKWLQTRVV